MYVLRSLSVSDSLTHLLPALPPPLPPAPLVVVADVVALGQYRMSHSLASVRDTSGTWKESETFVSGLKRSAGWKSIVACAPPEPETEMVSVTGRVSDAQLWF